MNPTDSNTRLPALKATVRQLQDVVSRLRALQTDTLEYACLKALVLFKPGMKTDVATFFNFSEIY